ncbi:inovirus Gp2 family protein [Pseudoalteromonas sp. Angola-4]|uniref:inovirus Gp2 family protein n=1 Tax=Pseudoalteromonas sp. Angola-4 TaxID=3025335 RepID=UPI002359257D|nr:inovirus Gp2 family protein [Pseudoalteromonas sp. Angola-4]MDC9511412.1 inovirus Gp2 family protein [Pseudoalteromonas sp. Angola-4]
MNNSTQYPVTTNPTYKQYQTLARDSQPLVMPYLGAIEKVMLAACAEHKRTFAVRIDLRLPAHSNTINLNSNKVCTRFIASLESQIKADTKRKARDGKTPHPCNIRYIWTREKNKAHQQHYHFVLFFNKDRYHCTGKINIESDNLFTRIAKAWASALSLPLDETMQLAHLPQNAHYYLDVNNPNFTQDFHDLYYRLSYFAKLNTKRYGLGQRCFGYSQR